MNCCNCGISSEEMDLEHIDILASNSHMCEKAEEYFETSSSSYVCDDCWDEFLDSDWEFE